MGDRRLPPLALCFGMSMLLFFPPPTRQAELVPVGVVLDMTSSLGKTCSAALAMAVEDFYAEHSDYTTRMVLHTRDSGNDSVGAAAAALDLLRNVRVQAILGPGRSSQAKFVIELGNKTQVPVVSFSVTSPSLTPSQTPYFVRTTLNGMYQLGAISSIINAFRWRAIIPIYEDTEYGSGFLPYLIDAIQNVDAQVPYRCVIPTFASDDQISNELEKLMKMQTRVFVVHVLPPLSSRLFFMANKLGMMSKGYVWITTQGLTDLLSTSGSDLIDSMQGVIGVKAYVPQSEALDSFKARWRGRFIQKPPTANKDNLNIFCLWAYDTVTAMAMALEKVGTGNLTISRAKLLGNPTDLTTLGISQKGPALLESIRQTKLEGISGEFYLAHGQLQPSAFRIINFIGKGEQEIGFWTPEKSILQQFPGSNNISDFMKKKNITWPGYINDPPSGWDIPKNKKLIVGVPVKGGFSEFVDANKSKVTGYAIDVFEAVMKQLPYKVEYEYEPYKFAQHPGSYNDLVDQVFLQKFDAVVGDVTILANRSRYVDFTLPYTESGVSMVVSIKVDQSNNALTFLRPLTKELWLATLVAFFYTGFVIWVIEHRINDEFRGPPSQQMGTIFYFAFSTMVFAHKEKIESNLSRIVVIIWVFVVLILTSSYTASLASIMTAERLQPAITNVDELLKSGQNVGYQDGSFVLQFLKDLKFDGTKLKNYTSPEAYAEALSKGSQNGGVAAIFDEVPYLKLFLGKHCSDYTIVGPKHKANGFGFVFPKKSPMVPDVSRAILKVTQGKEMDEIERKWFGPQTSCPTESNSNSSNRLRFRSFWGLFLISGCVSVLSVLTFSVSFFRENKSAIASEGSLWRKLAASARYYDGKSSASHTMTMRKDDEVLSAYEHDSVSTRTATGAPSLALEADGSQSPFSFCNQSCSNNITDENRLSVELEDITVE